MRNLDFTLSGSNKWHGVSYALYWVLLVYPSEY